MLSTALIKVSILCFYRRITERLTNQFVYCKQNLWRAKTASSDFIRANRGIRYYYLLRRLRHRIYLCHSLYLHTD
jgi:hypothetical protein